VQTEQLVNNSVALDLVLQNEFCRQTTTKIGPRVNSVIFKWH